MNCKRWFPFLDTHEGQGQKVFETYSPSWIPRMAEPEGLEIQQIYLLIPFLDATNGRARKVSKSFSCWIKFK